MTVFHGDNAQGKSNLLEAVYFLATTTLRPGRRATGLVNWSARDRPVPLRGLWPGQPRRSPLTSEC